MEHESEIKRLEDIVERLLEGYTGLKAEIRQKEQEVRAQQAENDQLRQQVKAMDSERGDLGGRQGNTFEVGTPESAPQRRGKADVGVGPDGSESSGL